MYNSGLVAVVKCNGKILREDKEFIYLPFNSEYEILLKNLESRKCVVKISIDGQDVLGGNSLLLYPNSESELKGFLKGDSVTNKFKFIKKTEEISNYRGDRIDDGIIRIEYRFEEEIIKKKIEVEYWHTCSRNCWECCHSWNCPLYNKPRSIINDSYETIGRGISDSTLNETLTFSASSDMTKMAFFDEGITVKGSQTEQQFNYGNVGNLENHANVIILKLVGVKESGKIIEEPITIRSKKICPTCGKKSKSNLKFCSNCGTFLD